MNFFLDIEHPIRRGRHCVSELHAHLVFVTKYSSEAAIGHVTGLCV